MRSKTVGPRFRFVVSAVLACALVLISLALSSCGGPSFSPEVQGKLDRVLTVAISRYGAPGAMAGAWASGKGDWVGAEGKADVSSGRAMAPGDRFRIGSNSLFNYTDDEPFWAVVEAEPLKKWKPEQLVGVAVSHPPYFPPGQEWYYSNSNYILLGMAIEKVTGSDVEGEVGRRIIDRLGLKDTSFPTGPDIPGPFAHGYRDAPGTGELRDVSRLDRSSSWTAGAMISSLSDLRVFTRALAEGEMVSERSHREQLASVKTGIPFTGYGLGVFEIRGYVGHGGAISGYDTAMFHSPSRDATIVAMINKQPAGDVEPAAMQYMFPGKMSALNAR